MGPSLVHIPPKPNISQIGESMAEETASEKIGDKEVVIDVDEQERQTIAFNMVFTKDVNA